jgi:hypothetical protein
VLQKRSRSDALKDRGKGSFPDLMLLFFFPFLFYPSSFIVPLDQVPHKKIPEKKYANNSLANKGEISRIKLYTFSRLQLQYVL